MKKGERIPDRIARIRIRKETSFQKKIHRKQTNKQTSVWKKDPDCKSCNTVVHCLKWKYKLIHVWEVKGAFQLHQ